MFWLLLFTGLAYSSLGLAELSDIEDVFSLFTNNKHSLKNNHKADKNGKASVLHETYEMGFPPFPPLFYDSMPLVNPIKAIQDEKDPTLDVLDQKETKQKKKPKDKVIMSFTEFFIPLMNRKTNFDFPSFPKKLDFLDNILKSFGFKDVEEPVLKNARDKKSAEPNNFTKFEWSFIGDAVTNESKKNDKLKELTSIFRKPKEIEKETFQNGYKNEKQVLGGCCGNPECRGSCKKAICGDPEKKRKSEEEMDEEAIDYFGGGGEVLLKQEMARKSKDREDSSLDRIMRLSFLYTVPILIGIGGAILALEILRRDSRAKSNQQILKEYGPVQHC